MPTDLIKAARMFANGSHQRINTFRNPALQSSEVHLKSVAQIVSSVSRDEEVIAAAWLHDVVEDTGATFGDVERRFGVRVATLVHELTVGSYLVRGNRAARFAREKEHFARVSAAAITIKLADLIDTCRDLHKNEPTGFKRFALEARTWQLSLSEATRLCWQVKTLPGEVCARSRPGFTRQRRPQVGNPLRCRLRLFEYSSVPSALEISPSP